LSLSEFNLIEKYFYQKKEHRKDVSVGIGDDCALLNVPSGQLLTVTVDTMVENVHFLPSISPEDLAWKAIAVNLSDLAAMGAEPAWLTLALTLPEANETWLEAFSNSFFECVNYYGIQLVGGDTTSGPLSITVQAMGFTPLDSALKRSNAKPGDIICVTGNLGDAGLGLAISLGKHTASTSEHKNVLTGRFNRPTPRVAEGIALRNLASAAIDLSDGLAGDLLHILKESAVGAVVELDSLPLSNALLTECGQQQAIQFALSAGDDYELCFTIAEENIEKLEQALKSTGCIFTQIGRIVGGNELTYSLAGKEVELELTGYKHFHDFSNNL
jgi:thiamine-monophosphate kinase